MKRRIAGPLPESCVVEVGPEKVGPEKVGHEKVGHKKVGHKKVDDEKVGYEGPAVFLWILRSPDEEPSTDEESEEPIGNQKGKTKSPHTGATGTDPTVPPNPPTVEGEKSVKEPENAPVDAPHTEAPTEPEKQPGNGTEIGPEEQPGNGPGKEPTDGPESAPGNAPATEQVNEQPRTLTACEEFSQRLRDWQGLSVIESPKTTAHKFGDDISVQRENEDIILAILSVTESLDEDFARISAGGLTEMLREMRQGVNGGPFSAVLRPRRRWLLPWIDCFHSFLVVVTSNPASTPAGIPTAQLQIYDSASVYHRGECPKSKGHSDGEHIRHIHNEIRALIRRAGWFGNPPDGVDMAEPDPPIIINQRASGQRCKDTCGLHTVFNAWAIAMNLRINPDMTASRRQEFYEKGLLIMSLAVQGRMDSRTIIKFFECYGFIQAAGDGE